MKKISYLLLRCGNLNRLKGGFSLLLLKNAFHSINFDKASALFLFTD
jgi:hypothetical protein